jgi:hypothetical protein
MRYALLVFIAAVTAHAQVEIFGLRTYANDDEYRPPIISRSEQVTIEFDVATALPPNVQILFRHTSRDWTVDDNVYINDPAKVRADVMSYTAAPAGVYQYKYRYRNSFPNKLNNVSFLHSGNYLYTIVDHDRNDEVLGTGAFIVTESSVPVTMSIENKYHSEYASPLNQRNFISVDVVLPAEYTAGEQEGIFYPDVKHVDIIQNWNLRHPYSIDQEDRDPETFVENFTKPAKTFWRRDVPVGNEYRRLDLSSVAFYPNNRLAILRENPDVSRYLWQGKPDANGASKVKAFTGTNSDYVEVELRLRLPEPPANRVFVVGGFTGWDVLPQYELKPDPASGLFVIRFWVQRGVYDYQYVLGKTDDNGNVTEQDWITLEGNDWRTVNRYTALVYYHDQRYGGFDRVIGSVRGRNPGGREPGKISKTANPAGKDAPVRMVPMNSEKGKN